MKHLMPQEGEGGGGGASHKKLGFAVLQLQYDKFNVEGIRIHSTWENGGGGDKLTGGGSIHNKNG